MDAEKKNPEDMTSAELSTALKNGTIGGDKPKVAAKSKTSKVADVKPKIVKASKAAAKKSAPKAEKKAARKFGVASVITLDKLSALLKRKPHTAAELAKIFRRSAIAVKRQVEKISGVKLALRAADGSIGRRPNVYSLA